MKVIGITGGVGAGKSELLKYISLKYNSGVIYSDNVANEIKKKGTKCYDKIVSLLGKTIVGEDGEIDKTKMAAMIFANDDLLYKVNDILHPAVEEYIDEKVSFESKENKLDFLFIEAALLIESGYKEKVYEMWYVKASKDVRRKRLKESRGYSDSKIREIFDSQLSDEEFIKGSDFVIDNDRDISFSEKEIDNRLEGILSGKY